ncbi:MAG: 30S ribosomal protein S4 [Chloroflexota bacterium]|nr:30S ribosomal protein S4 [Chloroflexota bacterium]
MGRRREPSCKLCRREGRKLFLKGERCFSDKCAMERRGHPPGAHGRQSRFQRESDYGEQLRQKQAAKRVYGVREKQFRRYYELAERVRGRTGAALLGILERRMDNVVYRLGFADSRAQARQLVVHGHFDLNERRMNVPSALVEVGDEIRVRESSRNNGYFNGLIKILEHRTVPEWLSLDATNMSGTVLNLPTREQIDTPIEEQLIVEYYSR